MNKATTPLRVLCVDDDVHVLGMVADTLRAEGFDVQTAIDGSHALQKLATDTPSYDLLIVDGRMPNVDGGRLILWARDGGYKGKIIVFSAWLDRDERKRYEKLDVDAVIEKPPKRGELLRAVKRMAAASV